MSLTITDDHMTGDHTPHTASRVPGRSHAWEVSWLPGRLMTRNTAITAMVLADVAASRAPQPGDRLWPDIESWTTVVGLTAPDALARVAAPPGYTSAGTDGAEPPDPEAGS